MHRKVNPWKSPESASNNRSRRSDGRDSAAMHRKDIDRSLERTQYGSVANVESVVNRLHTVRSSMREHSASNEALLAAIASMVADGKSASKAGLEEAMRGLERQRRETLEAREEAKRAHELLLVMESELVTVETTRRELAQAQEALAKMQDEYDAESSLRSNLSLQNHELTLKLDNAERESQSRQLDLDRMRKELLDADEARKDWEQQAKSWELSDGLHDKERLAEWECLSRVMKTETLLENAVSKAARTAQQSFQGQHSVLSQNRALTLQAQRSQERVAALQQELESAKEKNKQFSQQIKRLSEAAASGEEDISRLRTELNQLQESHTQLKQKDKESEKALSDLKAELREKDKSLLSKTADLDAYDYCVRNVSNSLPRVTEWRINDLGMTIALVSSGKNAKKGEKSVVLDAIIDGGPAATCEKLNAGDTLVQVNDRSIDGLSLYQIQNMLRALGNSIKLTVRHATKGTTFSVMLNKDTGSLVSSSVFEQVKEAYKTAGAWRAELHSMQTRVDGLEGELGGSSSKNVELLGLKQTSHAVLSRVISDLQDSIEDMHRVIADQRTEIGAAAAARDRYKQLQSQLDEEVSKQALLKSQLSAAELERAGVDQEMKLLFEKLQNDLHQSEQRNSRASEHLRHQKQRAEEAEGKLQRAIAELTEKSQDAAASTLQLEHVTELHRHAAEDLEQARAELGERRAALAQSSHQLTEALQALNQVHDAVCRHSDAQYCGVGLRVATASADPAGSPSRVLVIDGFVAGGPAAASGDLVEGDPILQVDGKSVQGMTASEVQKLLLGSAGSTVQLAAQRGAGGARYRAAKGMQSELVAEREELAELREEVKRLKAAVSEVHYWEGRFMSLEVEHTALEQEAAGLRDKVVRLDATAREAMSWKQGLDAMELELEAMRRELQRTRDQLTDCTRRLEQTTGSKATLQEELDFSKNRIVGLDGQLAMVTVDRDRLSREVVRLSAEKATLEAMQGGQGEAKEEIARLMEMVEVEATRAESALAREAEAGARAARGEEERRRLEEELAAQHSKLEAALAELKRWKGKADHAEQALHQAQGGSSAATSLKMQLEQRLEASRAQLQDKDGELDAVRGELERMRVALKDMARQRDDLAHDKASLVEDLEFCKGRETTLENHVSLLKLEIERLKGLIQRLTDDKAALEHTISAQESTMADLRAGLEAARVENGRLLGIVEAEKQRADSAELREAEAKNRISWLEEERRRLLEQIEVLRRQLEASQMENEVLAGRLEAMRVERDQLREVAKMVSVLEAERDAVQLELEKAVAELEQLRAENEQAYDRLKHEIERAARVVREQQEVNAALRSENESLFEDMEAAKLKAHSMQGELRAAVEENERLKLEISSLLSQLDEARRRGNDNLRKSEVLVKERTQLEEELRKLRGEGEELSSVLEEAALERQGLKGSQQQLEAELKAKRDEALALTRRIQELQVELTGAHEALEDEEAQRAAAEEEVARLRGMLEGREAKVYELSSTLKDERASLEAITNERDELSGDLDKERERGDGLQAELARAHKEIGRLKAEAAGRGVDAEALRGEKGALEAEAARLEAELSKAMEEVAKGTEQLRVERERGEEAETRLQTMEDEAGELQGKLGEAKKREEEAREERRGLGRQLATLEGACTQLNKQVADRMREVDEVQRARERAEEQGKSEQDRARAAAGERERAREAARVAEERCKEAERKRAADAEQSKAVIAMEKRKVEAAVQREESVRALTLGMYTELSAARDEAATAHSDHGMALAIVKQQQQTLSSVLERGDNTSSPPPAKSAEGWRGSAGTLLEELRALGKLQQLVVNKGKAEGVAEIQQLLLRIQQEEQQRVELELLSQGLQTRLDSLAEEARGLDDARRKAAEELAAERAAADALRTKLRAEEERLVARSAEVEALHVRVAGADKEREALRAGAGRAGREVARELQAVKEALSGPLGFFRQREGEVEAELRALGEAAARTAAELARVRQELADGKRAWEASRAKAGTSGAALSGVAVGLGRMVGEVRAAEGEVKRLAKEQAAMGAELQETRERLRRAEEGQSSEREGLARLEAELARTRRRAEDAEGERDRYKEELVEALRALEAEAEAARVAGEEAEAAMQSVLLVREELVGAARERDRHREAARAAREEADATASKAEEQIRGLRGQLRDNVHQLHGQMSALQSENDDAFSAMRMLHDHVTALTADMHKRSAECQARVEAMEAQCAGVGVSVAGQEGELAVREMELQRACAGLEEVMVRLDREQQARAQSYRAAMQLKEEAHAAAGAAMRGLVCGRMKGAYGRRLTREVLQEWIGSHKHWLQLASSFAAVRGQQRRTLLRGALTGWRELTGLDAWMERVAQRFATRWVVPSVLSPALSHWSKHTLSAQRFIIARWERLAVGAAVVRLRDATRSPYNTAVSPPPGVQRLITSKYLRDTRGEAAGLYSSASSTASLRLNLNSFNGQRGSASPPAHSFRSTP